MALHLPNCPQFAIAYFGLLKAGAVFVPLSPLLAEREISFQLNDSGAETFIGLDLLYGAPRNVMAETAVKNVILVSLADCYPPLNAPAKMLTKAPFDQGVLDFTEFVAGHPAEPPEVSLDPHADLAHIAYTGGTTGTPKGVMLTHANVMANCYQFATWFGRRHRLRGRPADRAPHGRRYAGRPPGAPGSRDIPGGGALVPRHGSGRVPGHADAGGPDPGGLPRFEPEEYLRAIPKYRATVFGERPSSSCP